MKIKGLYKILGVMFIFLFIFSTTKYAESDSSEYNIDEYNIDIVVNENNTFDITETIIANFSVEKHGIERKIPLKNKVVRNDGTTSKNAAKITNLSVSDKFEKHASNGYLILKIGDSEQTIRGRHLYTIRYTYNIGKDPLKNADELYYNLIGNEWDTNINKVTFKIKMPKEFDASSLGFSSGEKGSIDSSEISYSVDGNVITGSLNKTLTAEQGLTIRLTLPEGYFVNASLGIDGFSVFVIIVSLAFVLIADNLWYKYGKDDQVVETVEFYPPEEYNSAEAGFLYKGYSDTKSIVSLLIYLANKGYLKIEEIEQQGILNKKNKEFKITKIKEYDGDNENEKEFFNGLFKQKDSVTAKDLYNKFYITLDNIKENIESKKNKSKIFDTIADSKIKWLIIMIIAILFLITIKPVSIYGGMMLAIFAIIFTGVGFYSIFSSIFGLDKGATLYVNGKESNSKSSKITFGVVFGLIFGLSGFFTCVYPAITLNPIYIITYIIGLICMIVLMFFVKVMPKRTKYGIEILGKLKGFKEFLETAEKPQLEMLVEKDPEYFYNILPYTYALDVSDVWIKQFETMAIKAPSWYENQDTFDAARFGMFMNNTMLSAENSMSSSPQNDSASGMSGGGSSGGGSGGGRRKLLVVKILKFGQIKNIL